MISLTYPKDTENYYLFVLGAILGPFGSDFSQVGEVMEFTPKDVEIMGETRGIFYENNVTHDKIGGNIAYNPILGDSSFLSVATPQYPDRVQLSTKGYTGLISNKTADYGYISDHACVRSYSSASNPTYCLHREYSLVGEFPHWYEVNGKIASPGHVDYYWRYDITSYQFYTGDYIKVFYTKTQYVNSDPLHSGWDTGINWNEPQEYGVIQSIGPAKVASTSSTYALSFRYRPSQVYTFSPQYAVEYVSMLVDQYYPNAFPLDDTHYGDLAMSASEKIAYNNVNMISFLRDIRHPTEMIPKLKNLQTLMNKRSVKNLKSLKDLSNDYLTVKYGILPTISDIKEIFSAFESVRPYLDRNGFKTYSAGTISHLDQGDCHYDLEQHIKLAIDNEDSLLQLLDEQLESVGLLPTFQNLWDLVPYSFVIDWFAGVGELLERVDTRLRLERLNIRYVTMSRKATVIKKLVSGVKSPYSGELSWVRYHRWVSDQCPVPPLSLKSTMQTFNHWLESAALLIQRKKH